MSANTSFTAQPLADFERDGYVIIPHFFSSEEANLIYQTSAEDSVIHDKSLQGDVSGLYGSGTRTVKAAELMHKEPNKGRSREWHQDYGYRYNNGFLYPDMVGIMLALSEANRENGVCRYSKEHTGWGA